MVWFLTRTAVGKQQNPIIRRRWRTLTIRIRQIQYRMAVSRMRVNVHTFNAHHRERRLDDEVGYLTRDPERRSIVLRSRKNLYQRKYVHPGEFSSCQRSIRTIKKSQLEWKCHHSSFAIVYDDTTRGAFNNAIAHCRQRGKEIICTVGSFRIFETSRDIVDSSPSCRHASNSTTISRRTRHSIRWYPMEGFGRYCSQSVRATVDRSFISWWSCSWTAVLFSVRNRSNRSIRSARRKQEWCWRVLVSVIKPKHQCIRWATRSTLRYRKRRIIFRWRIIFW